MIIQRLIQPHTNVKPSILNTKTVNIHIYMMNCTNNEAHVSHLCTPYIYRSYFVFIQKFIIGYKLYNRFCYIFPHRIVIMYSVEPYSNKILVKFKKWRENIMHMFICFEEYGGAI